MMINSNFKKILITGCDGFTGKILAARLSKNNYQVFGNEFKIDISDYKALESYVKKIKPEFIVNLAAISDVVNEDEEKLYKINLFGALNVLRAVEAAKILPRKIIFASSAYVYGNCPQKYISETVCPQPINHYGNSKLAMENMVVTWFDQFPIIITRPFNYTGVGQTLSFLIPKIIRNFQEKKPVIELGNINVTREISDVNFVSEIYSRLLESNIYSEIMNICSGVGYTLNGILEKMREISGHNPEIKVNPYLCRKNEIHRLVGCNQKLSDKLGVMTSAPLNEILQKMYYALQPDIASGTMVK
jgi:GDP-6-deoxy-D-talose 4-dehydrogenase